MLLRNDVGRVAVARGGVPHIVPVTSRLDHDGSIVFRSVRGTELHVAAREITRSAFEVDDYDPRTGAGAAVVVRGSLSLVVDAVESQQLSRLGVRPWLDGARRASFVRLGAQSVTGWVLPPRR